MNKQWWLEPCRVPDEAVRQAARQRDAQLTKPAGALGRIDAVIPHLAALQGRERPSVQRIFIAIFAGDHGVAEEGISAFPQSVTAQMLGNFVNGGAAISVLAKQLDATLEVIDLGTAAPLSLPRVRHLSLGPGTCNFTRESAMSAETCQLAMEAGRNTVLRAQQQRSELFIGGEMGIGNTTTAAALACALLGCAPHELAGPGTGLECPSSAKEQAMKQENTMAPAAAYIT